MEKKNIVRLTRREFLKGSAAGLAGLSALKAGSFLSAQEPASPVALIRTQDRKFGVREALRLLEFPPLRGRSVFIKPNFNTADPTPGSTHNDTLSQLIGEIRDRGAADITVGDRCGPGSTRKVMEDKGIFDLSSDLDFKLIDFEEMEEGDWVNLKPEGSHWSDGFEMARPLIESEYTVSTCCLKTHQFGGIFTMSLKLSVGGVHRKRMRQLHSSPEMRKMIAEINLGYKPQLIVMDGVEVFTDGGPMTGTKKAAHVFLASTDRVAIDAVGLAVLKDLGSNEAIMEKKIFDQEQIKRAVELGLGASGPDRLRITPADDPQSRAYASRLNSILAQG